MSENTMQFGDHVIDYEDAKQRFFTAVVPVEGNEHLLSVTPHEKLADLAVVNRMDLSDVAGAGTSILVNQFVLDRFGVSEEQLKQDVLENAPLTHPVVIEHLDDVLAELSGGMYTVEKDPSMPPLLIATSESFVPGSGVIAYPDFFDKAAEMIGGDFFVLPSSTEEVLLLGDDGTRDYHELDMLVMTINMSQVSPEERLTNHSFHYDTKDRIFEKASEFAERMEAKEMSGPSILQKLEESKGHSAPKPEKLAPKKDKEVSL